MNVLVQLASPTVDLKKPETVLFLLQTIYQAGPTKNNDVRRETHGILTDRVFASTLLTRVKEAASRIKENWESLFALSALVSITTRVLSLVSEADLVDESLRMLGLLRGIGMNWLLLLSEKRDDTEEEDQRQVFTKNIVQMATIVTNTFAMDDEHLERLLSDTREACLFIQCCISISMGGLPMSGKDAKHNTIMYRGWMRLAYRAHSLLRNLVIADSSCLDDAVSSAWPDYLPGTGGWQGCSGDDNPWMATTSASTDSRSSLPVHYNLLTGRLLVNGQPLSQLPEEYIHHESYADLFGRLSFRVLLSSVPGFQFSLKHPHHGHLIQLGLDSGASSPDLLVQAEKDGCAYDFVPRRVFDGFLPVTFVHDYVHWYNAATRKIEFRDRKHPWDVSAVDSWFLERIDETSASAGWRLSSTGGRTVLFPKSNTGQALSRILSPLQKRHEINLILSEDKATLQIDLPRIQQGFYLAEGSSVVHSQQNRGFEIDKDQDVGTLIGLQNKLVLRHRTSGERRLVVPAGHASYSVDKDGMKVTIKPDTAAASTFGVNTILRRLETNGSLQSNLYLCYLHALTSFCLPDPLSGFTGTEQALAILRSAAVSSTPGCLDKCHLDLLRNIMSLTPVRTYYPKHLRAMQTVQWDPQLPVLSQHAHFRAVVESLLEQDNVAKIYEADVDRQATPRLVPSEPILMKRAASRCSVVHTHGFGAEDRLATAEDRSYACREPEIRCPSEQMQRATDAAYMLLVPRGNLQVSLGAGLVDKLWGVFCDSKYVHGANTPYTGQPSGDVVLAYGSQWLAGQSNHWGRLWMWLHQQAKTGRTMHSPSRFQLSFWLATMAFAGDTEMDVIQLAASIFAVPGMASVQLPGASEFEVSLGYTFDRMSARSCVSDAFFPFYVCPEQSMPAYHWESDFEAERRRNSAHESNQDAALANIMDFLSTQWPCQTLIWPDDAGVSTYINVPEAKDALQPLWTKWYQNWELRQYLIKIVNVARRQSVVRLEALKMPLVVWLGNPPLGCTTSLSANDLFSVFTIPSKNTIPPRQPKLSPEEVLLQLAFPVKGYRCHGPSPGQQQRQPLLEDLVQRRETVADSEHEKNYARELRQSLDHLQSGNADQSPDSVNKTYSLGNGGTCGLLEDHLSAASRHVSSLLDTIERAILDKLAWSKVVRKQLHHGTRYTPILLLQQLRHDRWECLPEDWRQWIVAYGLALTEVQRSQRLLQAMTKGNTGDFVRELQNEGHTNWNPLDKPEALLLEIENNILIRPVQVDIAQQMSEPPNMRNAVMQLNMGEGKSSVIVPLVVLAAADGQRLARVIVAKPQSRQMMHMLVSKLGGLLNRRVFHLPFSRALRFTPADTRIIHQECLRCIESRGVLLVQPEHILSFKLMGIESMIVGKADLGRQMLETQKLFHTKSRDIVDESDENFSVKFELVYTMGTQGFIEFRPDRWIVIQTVLDFVRHHAIKLHQQGQLAQSIEVHEQHYSNARGFPRLRLLKQDASDKLLLETVARDICESGFSGFPVARQGEASRQDINKYITEEDATDECIAAVEKGPFWNDTTKNSLLLLRGLFAGGILFFVFGQKRWRVHYGLNPDRQPPTKLAVPYRAKDQPSARSEYSHTDVIIALTCLCYYYQGLDDDGLFLAFENLVNSDQAHAEYQAWVDASDKLPASFRNLEGINLKDVVQCKAEVFPCLRFAKPVVDYFLRTIVFPKEMYEFPRKLSASGWDIAAIKPNPTTGFSGTMDSRHVLPLDIKHLDLSAQKHTNALVLEYLLQPENSVVLLKESTTNTTTEDLLNLIVDHPTETRLRVVLDVGAQILELTNRQVAETWLKKERHRQQNHSVSKVEAAVYFDDHEEIVVLGHKGRTEPLRISPYVDQLDLCVVFLDEAHTRGTDLRLPDDYRAAVTLGAKLTKDRLVQACMRMRKLGKGQSVLFCVPPEIQTKIRENGVGTLSRHITVSDVLFWAIGETHNDLNKSIPLWAVQGRRYERQRVIEKKAAKESEQTGGSLTLSLEQAQTLQEDEAMSIEARYRPKPSAMPAVVKGKTTPRLQAIHDRCAQFSHIKHNEAALHEEQERELSPEVERERQLERPPPAKAAQHALHCDVVAFVNTGRIPAMQAKVSNSMVPAFQTLRQTTAAQHLDVNMFPQDILVTADFARTVVAHQPKNDMCDAFQRPVQWILSSQPQSWKHMVIISPFEAQQLLPTIRTSRHVSLHLYSPRPNLEIAPLDGLDLYTVSAQSVAQNVAPPPLRLRLLLNLFAGQLYFQSYEEYTALCDLLGLSWKGATDDIKIAADGFILSSSASSSEESSSEESGTVASLGSASMVESEESEECKGFKESDSQSESDSELELPPSFKQSPVPFLKVFVPAVRRDGYSINKTHLGKLLEGTLLRKRDFKDESVKESD